MSYKYFCRLLNASVFTDLHNLSLACFILPKIHASEADTDQIDRGKRNIFRSAASNIYCTVGCCGFSRLQHSIFQTYYLDKGQDLIWF